MPCLQATNLPDAVSYGSMCNAGRDAQCAEHHTHQAASERRPSRTGGPAERYLLHHHRVRKHEFKLHPSELQSGHWSDDALLHRNLRLLDARRVTAGACVNFGNDCSVPNVDTCVCVHRCEK